MKLKKIGFYKELNHGDKSGMSLKESINNSPIESSVFGFEGMGSVYFLQDSHMI